METRLGGLMPHEKVLYSFNALSLVGGIVYGLYYGIFLYKQSFSLSILALDGFFGGIGTWLGYLIGVAVVKRWGYKVCFRMAFGLWAAVSFGTALSASHIAQWFVAIALIKALPAGMYAATCDTIMLREVRQAGRERFLQLKLAFEFGAAIILPTLIGALIKTTGGYQYVFALAGMVYVAALFVPVRLNRPKLSCDIRRIFRQFRRPLYPYQAANRTLASGFNQLNAFVAMIIPFLLLGDELKIGLLTSGIAIMAVSVSLLMRRVRAGKQVGLGYLAYGVRAAASLSFILFWTAPVLLIWQTINKLVTPLHDPLQQGLDIHNDSLIMGSDRKEQALQINLLNNSLMLVGTLIAYGGFFLLTRAEPHAQRAVLQWLIIAYAGWRIINLTVTLWINRTAQAGPVPEYRQKVPLLQVFVWHMNALRTRARFYLPV